MIFKLMKYFKISKDCISFESLNKSQSSFLLKFSSNNKTYLHRQQKEFFKLSIIIIYTNYTKFVEMINIINIQNHIFTLN